MAPPNKRGFPLMPWKQVNGQLELSGNLAQVAQTMAQFINLLISSIPSSQTTSKREHHQYFILSCAQRAMDYWGSKNESRHASILTQLANEVVSNQRHPLDVLDYVCENATVNQCNQWMLDTLIHEVGRFNLGKEANERFEVIQDKDGVRIVPEVSREQEENEEDFQAEQQNEYQGEPKVNDTQDNEPYYDAPDPEEITGTDNLLRAILAEIRTNNKKLDVTNKKLEAIRYLLDYLTDDDTNLNSIYGQVVRISGADAPLSNGEGWSLEGLGDHIIEGIIGYGHEGVNLKELLSEIRGRDDRDLTEIYDELHDDDDD